MLELMLSRTNLYSVVQLLIKGKSVDVTMNLMHVHTYDGFLITSFATYFKQSGTIHFEEQEQSLKPS